MPSGSSSLSFGDNIQRIRAGEDGALDRLLCRWRPLLRLHARGLLGARFSARADSSDLVQETIARASRDFAKFRGSTEGEWVCWLQSILAVQAAKLRRHHLAAKRNVVREANPYAPGTVEQISNPLAHMLDHEHLARLADAIEQLPEPMREVIVRRVFEQQPFEEIAAELQRSPGATRVLWTRALRKLRDAMSPPVEVPSEPEPVSESVP